MPCPPWGDLPDTRIEPASLMSPALAGKVFTTSATWEAYIYTHTHTHIYRGKDILFIIGDWNAKVGSQETPGITGKFGLGVQNEAGQRLIEFCDENALIIASTLFQQHKRRLYT